MSLRIIVKSVPRRTFPQFCSAGPLEPYLAKARWICQSIHPFLDISRVFYAGVPDAAQEDELDAYELVSLSLGFIFLDQLL